MVDLEELNERIRRFSSIDIPFFKYTGTGNKLAIIDEFRGEVVPEEDKPDFSMLFCRADYGIGADGIMFLQKSDKADARMRFFNIDGAESEMCGNGMRCIADHLLNYHVDSESCTIEVKAYAKEWDTAAGKFDGSVVGVERSGNGSRMYTVSMGDVTTEISRMPSVHNSANQGTEHESEMVEFDYRIDIENPDLAPDKTAVPSSFPITLIDTGEPHIVIFAEEVSLGSFRHGFRDKTVTLKGIEMDSDSINRLLDSMKEDSRYFSQTKPDFQVNVNLVEVVSDDRIRILTSERGGAGITESCGTGSTACAAVSRMLGKAKSSKILVENTGGNLTVEDRGGRYYLTGPVRLVSEGRIRNA